MTDDNGDGELSDFQQLLADYYSQLVARTKRRKMSDNAFARHLEVSPASLNMWINSNRKPDLENAMRLARKIGPEVYDTLGYPRLVDTVRYPELRFIIDNWHLMDDESKQQIKGHVEEVSGKFYEKRGKSK